MIRRNLSVWDLVICILALLCVGRLIHELIKGHV